VYLTARSYLLAGFTAASIVATIPFAPRPTVHLPDIHEADIRLAAAESKIAATVHTLRVVEARAVASAAPAVAIPPSAVGAAVGDLLALNFDLTGTPAAFMNSLSFLADATIATLTGGTAENLPPNFGVADRLNLLSADLKNLTDAINHITGILQSESGANGSGTQSGINTGTGASSQSGAAAAATGAPDLSALGPLIGDVAILGVDMTASPYAVTQTWTRALAAASTDLGAGEIQAAQKAFTTILQAGLTEAQTRITNDTNNIGAVLARLVGTSSTTTGQVGTANSVTGAASALAAAKTSATSAVQSRPVKIVPRPVIAKPASSTTAVEAVSADHHRGAAHNPTTVGTATAAASTGSTGSTGSMGSMGSQQGSSHIRGTTTGPTRRGDGTTSTTKPATQSPTKARGANGTSTAKHSAPGKPHNDGAKHGKH
jgi:hypothetical protein